ncbi:MAG: hypothetical protein LBT01_03285 [Spirochaetaceae bacterium]|nr:hypothetical protein [Spirochaetaceae bacterium]
MSFEFLDDERYRKSLASVFQDYYFELEGIVELATIENHGIRPEGLTNEIYALFHHISRSLCSITDVEQAAAEIDRAKKTHLKRAILDSYKITINSLLKKTDSKVDLLEDLAADPDYRESICSVLEDINPLRKFKKKIKFLYLDAKKTERKGDTDVAISLYNASLEKCVELSEKIDEIDNNSTYLLALKRIKRIEKAK